MPSLKSTLFSSATVLLCGVCGIASPMYARQAAMVQANRPGGIDSQQLRPLLDVYRQYGKIIRTQGAAGLPQLATSDFMVQADSRTGPVGNDSFAAIERFYRRADKVCREASQGKKPDYSLQIEPVDITADTAVVYLAETFTGADKGISITQRWKQTWRKDGAAPWKLAVMGSDSRTAEQREMPALQLTVDALPENSLHFVALYKNYVDTIQQRGDAGFAALSTADFVVRNADGSVSKSDRGVETGGLYDFVKNKDFVVRVKPVKLAEQFAVLVIEDSVTDTMPLEEAGKKVTTTARWNWQQTWRKTADGWKIASIMRVDPLKTKRVQKPQYAFALHAGPDGSAENPDVATAIAPFVPVYQKYVSGYIGREGEAGLRQLVAPDFVWHSGAEQTAVRGDAAITQAAKELGISEANPSDATTTYTRSIAVRCAPPRMSSSGDEAVIDTEFGYGFIVQEATTAKGGTALGLYRMTWKKTPQGWKLSSVENAVRPDAAPTEAKFYVPVAQGEEKAPKPAATP